MIIFKVIQSSRPTRILWSTKTNGRIDHCSSIKEVLKVVAESEFSTIRIIRCKSLGDFNTAPPFYYNEYWAKFVL